MTGCTLRVQAHRVCVRPALLPKSVQRAQSPRLPAEPKEGYDAAGKPDRKAVDALGGGAP